MEIAIIAAIARNRVIGKNGKIPWHELNDYRELRKKDLDRFKSLTISHPVIMGRKTYESVPNALRPLPKRTNIVLSRNQNFRPNNNVIVACSLQKAVEEARKFDEKIFVIGGTIVYQEALQRFANRLYLTDINESFEGDTFFPEFGKEQWEEIARQAHGNFSFVNYMRRYWSA